MWKEGDGKSNKQHCIIISSQDHAEEWISGIEDQVNTIIQADYVRGKVRIVNTNFKKSETHSRG